MFRLSDGADKEPGAGANQLGADKRAKPDEIGAEHLQKSGL
jgi:hypothetical protein